MSKRVATIAAIGALAPATMAAGASAAPPADQTTAIWAQLCVNVAHGEVFAHEPGGPLDCDNPRTEFPGFKASALTVLQRTCEESFGGEFLVRSQDTQHAYCFLP